MFPLAASQLNYQQSETNKEILNKMLSPIDLVTFSDVSKNTLFITKFRIMIDLKRLPDNTDQSNLVYICIRLA